MERSLSVFEIERVNYTFTILILFNFIVVSFAEKTTCQCQTALCKKAAKTKLEDPRSYAIKVLMVSSRIKEVVNVGNLPTPYECAVACRKKLAPLFYYGRRDMEDFGKYWKGLNCRKSGGCPCFCHLNSPSKCVKEYSPFYDLYKIKAEGNFLFVIAK